MRAREIAWNFYSESGQHHTDISTYVYTYDTFSSGRDRLQSPRAQIAFSIAQNAIIQSEFQSRFEEWMKMLFFIFNFFSLNLRVA